MLQVKITKMNDLKFEKNLFQPLKTGRAIDKFYSNEGGVMPGTNTVITGDPGVGKTTVLLDLLADMNDKGKRVLFVSGEMNQIDMVGYVRRFPKFGDVPIMFMGDVADEDPLEMLRNALNVGYDCVLIDSIAELAVAIQDYYGGTYKGATTKLLTLLEEQNMGENDRKINTASLLIQQVTKSGSFVGSNRIKHMTTAMGHLKFDGDGGRYLAFSKNRRGGNMNKFYFNLNTKNQVNWMYEAPANMEG
jgi:predicted ATP-dependent serine protease